MPSFPHTGAPNPVDGSEIMEQNKPDMAVAFIYNNNILVIRAFFI